MTRFIGAVLGAAHAAMSGAVGSLTNPAYHNGRVARIAKDYWTGDAAENDYVSLVYVGWDTVFDEISTLNFDDFGTSITLDVGVALDPDCLIAAQDVATAAGSVGLMKSVGIANRHKPLWQLAGYASLQAAREATKADGGRAELIATFKGGNPTTGALAWTIYGSPQ